MSLNIALIEPEIPQNTGNIARTCAATGSVLHLVKPLGFSIDDRYLKRAGLDYWSLLDIRIYENRDEFFEKNKKIRRRNRKNLYGKINPSQPFPYKRPFSR